MGVFRPTRFTSLELLGQIERGLLRDLLGTYHDEMVSIIDRGDLARVAAMLAMPDERMNAQLSDALVIISEVDDARGRDALVDRLRSVGPPQDGMSEAEQRWWATLDRREATSADVAVASWLIDPRLVREEYHRRQAQRSRQFETFFAETSERHPWPRGPSRLERLRGNLIAHFILRGRGESVDIAQSEDDSGAVWLLVTHGDVCRRVMMRSGKTARPVVGRESLTDVIIYQPEPPCLRINTASVSDRETYRRELGLYVIDNPMFFPNDGVFSLAPLRERGADALVCGDIPGMERVRLCELTSTEMGSMAVSESARCRDLFARRPHAVEVEGQLTSARFEVKFSGDPTPRRFLVRPPNIARFGKNDDSGPMQAWLAARGFASVDGSMEEDAATLWSTLAAGDDRRLGVRHEWTDWLGRDFPHVERCLQLTDQLADAYPCGARRLGCVRGVHHIGARAVALCPNDERPCKTIEVRAEDRQLWRLDVDLLAKWLGEKLIGLLPDTSRFEISRFGQTAHRFWRMGLARVAGRAGRVCLCLATTRVMAGAIDAYLARRMDTDGPTLLFVANDEGLGPREHDRLRDARCHVISLPMALAMGPQWGLVRFSPLGASLVRQVTGESATAASAQPSFVARVCHDGSGHAELVTAEQLESLRERKGDVDLFLDGRTKERTVQCRGGKSSKLRSPQQVIALREIIGARSPVTAAQVPALSKLGCAPEMLQRLVGAVNGGRRANTFIKAYEGSPTSYAWEPDKGKTWLLIFSA